MSFVMILWGTCPITSIYREVLGNGNDNLSSVFTLECRNR